MSNEQSIELQVRLEHDLSDDPDDYNMLVINEGRHHHVFEMLQDPTRMHTISWTLSGNAASGEFCALTDTPNPGFVWLVRTPRGNTFRNLLRVGTNKLTVSNRHCNAESKGQWYYQLFARFGNQVYGVPLTFANGPGSNPNPSIKNM